MTIFLVPLRISFILKFLKDTNTLWNMKVIWFLLLVHKYYFFFQDFKFLRSCVETVQSQMISTPFPAHLAREFKVKWWSNFSPCTTQQISHMTIWIFSKNSLSKPPKAPFQIILDNFLLSRSSFAYDKDFKMHLKILRQKASKTLSQFSDSDSDDDIASSAFLKDHNEDMCYDLLYMPLE